MSEIMKKYESIDEALARWGLIKFLEDAISHYVNETIKGDGTFTKLIEDRVVERLNKESLGWFKKLQREQEAQKKYMIKHNNTMEIFAEQIALSLIEKTK
jgi:hypothetical protein